jgi:hypothetical protein
MAEMIAKLNINTSKNRFKWLGSEYGDTDSGLFTAYPNPFNPARTVYLFSANSALQLYQMTHKWQRMPSWAVFKQDNIIKKGFHDDLRYIIKF